MTIDLSQELSPGKRRRIIYRGVLRGLLTATVLVVLYYVLPYRWSGATALRFLAGLLVFVGITVWQVRTISGSGIASRRKATGDSSPASGEVPRLFREDPGYHAC